MLGRLLIGPLVLTMLLPASCRKPNAARPTGDRVVEGPSKKDAVADKSVPAHLDIRVEPDGADRWLQVERVRGEAKGAWATGSFNTQRNRLDISTKNVERFAIDMERIPIDWHRVVVIRLDGTNSELRRRDQAVYHFSLDDRGRWVVLEP